MKIKDVIYESRKKNQMTQEQLATKIEVSNKTVSNWERGVSYPDILIVPKLCEVLGITINELFDVEDVKKIDGKIEYDKKTLLKFRTTFLLSMVLLLFPISITIGFILESRTIIYILVVLSALAYMYSISTMFISSINFYKYIETKYYSKEYKKTLKNFLLIFITTLFTMLSMILFLISNYYFKFILSISINIIFIIGLSILVKRLKFVFDFKEKLISNIMSILIFTIGILIGSLHVYVLGDLYIILLILSVWIYTSSLLFLSKSTV